jgi:hypothetical protein
MQKLGCEKWIISQIFPKGGGASDIGKAVLRSQDELQASLYFWGFPKFLGLVVRVYFNRD